MFSIDDESCIHTFPFRSTIRDCCNYNISSGAAETALTNKIPHNAVLPSPDFHTHRFCSFRADAWADGSTF